MNIRERFVNAALGKPVDRGVLWEDRLWNETKTRWLAEGWSQDYDFGYDFMEDDSWKDIGIDYGFLPRFQPITLADQGDTLLVRDEYGVVKEVFKGRTGMPRFISFPVQDRASWEEVKARLAGDNPDRYAQGWAENSRKAAQDGLYPLTLGKSHLCGFFSLLRELAGDECYYLFFDEPELVRDIMDFQANRIVGFIREATRQTPVDRLFIWEDMCYNCGPLISPQLFEEFLLEPYSRVIAQAKESGIPLVDVDSDGRIDKLIPLWLQAGVNMLHPFEVQSGMDVNRVRETFGYDFAMRGGVDKKALARGREAIDREIDRIRPVFEQGKYIPHVDHSVPPDVSYENYCYYFEQLKQLVGAV